MARNDISNPFGYVNARTATRAGSGGTGNHSLIDTHALSVDTLRGRLKTVAASTYTDAVLDNMTKNDMEYALRLLSDSTNVK